MDVKDTSDNTYDVLSWCTNEFGNEIMSSTTRVPTVFSAEIDDDDDGTTDRVDIHLRMPLKASEDVHRVWAVALFQYQLREFVEIAWEAAAVVEESSPLPGLGLVTDGSFEIRQRDLFSGFQRNWDAELYTDQLMLEADEDASVNDFLPQRMMSNYTSRDFSTTYAYRYPTWIGRTNGNPIDQSMAHFDLNMTIRAPTDTFAYRPKFGETFKYALMQYVAFYVVLTPLIALIKTFLFHHQIVETDVVAESPFGSMKHHAF